MAELRIGLGGAAGGTPAERRKALESMAEAGVDHVMVGDHVSFFVGLGFDALISAASILSLHNSIAVYTGIYLLPLRHPVLVARQLSDLAALAPGRLVFGVGVGGEDRHEVEVCGVDPSTRGKRMDECMQIVRGLLTGEPVSWSSEFFELHDALILPAPRVSIPMVVGGRSEAAVRRAGRYGDGWLGIWVSAKRYRSVVQQISDVAGEAGRGDDVAWHHGMQMWCGIGPSREEARATVAQSMQAVYQLPFETFEKYTPYGGPAEIAEAMAPFVDAGCRTFNLIAAGGSPEEQAATVTEIKKLLA
jgi:alkanesulfonate monooxygenase SsuD/methylene tetrahydromethanopterin reductase-like flavin-dependent oxidoreductase (luciferase family)